MSTNDNNQIRLPDARQVEMEAAPVTVTLRARDAHAIGALLRALATPRLGASTLAALNAAERDAYLEATQDQADLSRLSIAGLRLSALASHAKDMAQLAILERPIAPPPPDASGRRGGKS